MVCFDCRIELLWCLLKLFLHLHWLVIALWCINAVFNGRYVALVFVGAVGDRAGLTGDASLILDFDVDRLVVWFCYLWWLCILSGVGSMWLWSSLRGSDSAIHRIIHHLPAFVKSWSAHIEWVHAALASTLCATHATVAAVISVSRTAVWPSIVWDNASSDYTKSTWILALSSLLQCRWLILVIVLPLHWTCTELWQIMHHLSATLFNLCRLVACSIMGQSTSKLALVVRVLCLLYWAFSSILWLILILLINNFYIFIIAVWLLASLICGRLGMHHWPNRLCLDAGATQRLLAVRWAQSRWLMHQAHLILHINRVHLVLVEVLLTKLMCLIQKVIVICGGWPNEELLLVSSIIISWLTSILL